MKVIVGCWFNSIRECDQKWPHKQSTNISIQPTDRDGSSEWKTQTNKFSASFYSLSIELFLPHLQPTSLCVWVCCTISILIKKYRHNIFISMHKSIKYDINNSLKWIEMIRWHCNAIYHSASDAFHTLPSVRLNCAHTCILAFARRRHKHTTHTHTSSKVRERGKTKNWHKKTRKRKKNTQNNKMHFQCALCTQHIPIWKWMVRKHFVECKWLHTWTGAVCASCHFAPNIR